MANKLLICISITGTTVARWRGGRLSDCTVFDSDPDGVAAFRDYAAASRKIPALLIVDAIEEDYRFETLPHASGSDSTQMVERKLRQHYRNSPFSAALRLGRDSSKRRDDRFLFSALTNPEIVAPWLAVLAETGLPVGGVFLLPMVVSSFVAGIENLPNNLLVVATHPAGIRLTFFKEGAFRLSRLSRANTADDAQGRAILDEISNTRLYLHALRAATLDESVTVLLLDHADTLESAARAISEDNPNLKCTRFSRADIAKRIKLDTALIALSPATIYLHLLAAHTPTNNLAPATVTTGYRRYQSRRQLFAASAGVLALGAAWAGFNFAQYLSITDDIQQAAQRTARVNAEYQETTKQFPAAPTTADNLRRGIELADKLRASARTPEQFLVVVSRALEASPEINLVELGWQYRPVEYEVTGGTAAASQQPVRPAEREPGTSAGNQRIQSGLLAGQIRDFKGDFRGAIASINALAERLGKDPAVESVRIVQLPLNASPTLALTGNTADSPAQSGTADFKLVVVLKQST